MTYQADEKKTNRFLTTLLLCAFSLLSFIAPVSAKETSSAKQGEQKPWEGFERIDFQVEGRNAYLIVPKKPAIGLPWVWRARFPEYRSEINLKLLKQGVHIGYVDVTGLYGSPKAVAIGNAFYEQVVISYHLSPKPGLFGVSRGGLFVYNWALANPRKVACMYLDTPVLDFKSWPGGKGKSKGSAEHWQECLAAYGLTEEEALAYEKNPVDRGEEIFESKIFIRHLLSEDDKVVPPEENTYRLKENLPESFADYRWDIVRVQTGTEKSEGHHFDHPKPWAAAKFLIKFALYEGGSVSTDPGKTLEQIEEIYATIPPLEYIPPKVCGTKIPLTVEKIVHGEALRIVMLGDSIVNDTSNSAWNRLFDRDFPHCKLTKITSVRGSTGCWWYQEGNRVQRYVLDQKPDLVIIGGISQQENIEAIRTVIQNIQADKPDTEFLLMTGAYGKDINPIINHNWYPTIDPSRNDYRLKLELLAKELDIEFLDMRGAWGVYIKSSGKDTEWFKRDPVHANEKGKQVIGRILYRYLKASVGR